MDNNVVPKDIGYNMNLIFEAINNCPETKNIIALAHFEEYKDKNGDSLSYKFKTTGSMVDNYIEKTKDKQDSENR